MNTHTLLSRTLKFAALFGLLISTSMHAWAQTTSDDDPNVCEPEYKAASPVQSPKGKLKASVFRVDNDGKPIEVRFSLALSRQPFVKFEDQKCDKKPIRIKGIGPSKWKIKPGATPVVDGDAFDSLLGGAVATSNGLYFLVSVKDDASGNDSIEAEISITVEAKQGSETATKTFTAEGSWTKSSANDDSPTVLSWGSLDEAAGPEYRKIGLNGFPIGDEKPQAEGEDDYTNEASYVDALTLGLTHRVTDVFVPLPTSELSLSVRRNHAPTRWSLATLVPTDENPHPTENSLPTNPALPFGPGWSSNLAARVEIVTNTKVTPSGSDFLVEVTKTATVYDENGQSHRFVMIENKGSPFADVGEPDEPDERIFIPMPHSPDDTDVYQMSLKWVPPSSDGSIPARFIFTKKFGTTLIFSDIIPELTRRVPPNVPPAFPRRDSDSLYEYARLEVIEDRYGKDLVYDYNPQNRSLVPHRIRTGDVRAEQQGDHMKLIYTHQSQSSEVYGIDITFAYTKDSFTRVLIGSISDPRGGTVTYQYTDISDVSGPRKDVKVLTSVRPLGELSATKQYTYDRIDNDVPDSVLFSTSSAPFLQTYSHVNLASITDELDNTYDIEWTIDETKKAFNGDVGYYIENGLPRVVSKVTLPNNAEATFSQGSSSSQLEININSSGNDFDPSFNGKRETTVTDANGNDHHYQFSGDTIKSMPEINEVMGNFLGISMPESWEDKASEPRILYHTMLTITHKNSSGGSMGQEVFEYELESGLSLVKATDLSGNVKTYAYNDEWEPSAFGLEGIFGKPGSSLPFYPITEFYRDPNVEVNDANGEEVTSRFKYITSDVPQSSVPKLDDQFVRCSPPRWRVMSKVLDPEGRLTLFGVDPVFGRRIQKSVYSNHILDSSGQLNLAGQLMEHTSFEYDNQNFPNFVTKKVISNVNSGVYAEDATQINGGSNRVILMEADTKGRLKREAVDLNNNGSIDENIDAVSTHEYDANNNRIKTTGPAIMTANGLVRPVTQMAYDARNRVTQITHPDDSVSKMFYDARSNLVGKLDENGNATVFKYDSLNRRICEIRVMNDANMPSTTASFINYPDNGHTGDLVTKMAYNNLNALTSITDPNGNTTTNTYDALQRLIQTIEPARLVSSDGGTEINLNPTTTFTYGLNSGGSLFNTDGFKPTQIVDPRGFKTLIQYDGLYRPIKEVVQYAAGASPHIGLTASSTGTGCAVTEKAYDAVGNLKRSTEGTDDANDPTPRTTLMDYDALNRLTKVTNPDNKTTQTFYASTGEATRVVDELKRTTSNFYDAGGRLIKVEQPAVPDALNAGVTSTPTLLMAYDPAGNETSITNPLGEVTRLRYDSRGRKVQEIQALVEDFDSGGTLQHPVTTTVYDAVGNVRFIKDARNFITEMTYDNNNRNRLTIAPPVEDPANPLPSPNNPTQPPAGTTFAWSVHSGNPTNVQFNDPSLAQPEVTINTPGTYVLKVVATNGAQTATDFVTLTVEDPSAGTPAPDPDLFDFQIESVERVSAFLDSEGRRISAAADIDEGARFLVLSDHYNEDFSGSPLTPNNAPGSIRFIDLSDMSHQIIDLNMTGSFSDGHSFGPQISANGRVIAYLSFATDILPESSPFFVAPRIYIFDLDKGVSGETEMLFISDGNEDFSPDALRELNFHLSEDGNNVTFMSRSTELSPLVSPPLTEGEFVDFQIYSKDRSTSQITLITQANGVAGDGDSYLSDMSEDGRYVLLATEAGNLIDNDQAGMDILLYDNDTAEFELVLFASDIGDLFTLNAGTTAKMSDDARYVVFHTNISFSPSDTNNTLDIYRKDRQSGEIELVTVNQGGVALPENITHFTLSRDARYIGFNSRSGNVISDAFSGYSNYYIRDMLLGKTFLVNRSISNESANGNSNGLINYSKIAVNSEGKIIVPYRSRANNLVPNDMNGGDDLFLATINPVERVVDSSTFPLDDLTALADNDFYMDAPSALQPILDQSFTMPSLHFLPESFIHPVTEVQYDANGNVTQVIDPNGNATLNAYDAGNNLVSTTTYPTDTGSIVETMKYDLAGNRTSLSDGNGNATRFTYDGLSRNLATIDKTGVAETFTYNALNRTAKKDGVGNNLGDPERETTFTYDLRNRLTGISFLSDSRTRNFTYDVVGNLLTVDESDDRADVANAYDALNRLTSETSYGQTTEHTYDLAGNRITTTYAVGELDARTLSMTYDALNRTRTITEATRTTNYAYDLMGNLRQTIQGNGDLITKTYDTHNRTRSITGPSIFLSFRVEPLYLVEQSYDLNGNVVTIHENYHEHFNTFATSLVPDRNITNSYDGINRLLNESVMPAGHPPVLTQYTYDDANNRSTKRILEGGIVTQDESYTYNNLNQLASFTKSHPSETITYAYDAYGNRTAKTNTTGTDSLTWDQENRLISVDYQSATTDAGQYHYAYDHRVRRIERDERDIGGTREKIIFAGGLAIREYIISDDQGNQNILSKEYIRGNDYGGGIGGILYSFSYDYGLTDGASYNHYNARGDVIAKWGENTGIDYLSQYEAFGKHDNHPGVSSWGTNIDRQQGNTKDETPWGALNEGFRYRDLETGTFLSRDPLGSIDGPNLYTYVRQNPWSKFDPHGLQEKEEIVEPEVVLDFNSGTLLNQGRGGADAGFMSTVSDFITADSSAQQQQQKNESLTGSFFADLPNNSIGSEPDAKEGASGFGKLNDSMIDGLKKFADIFDANPDNGGNVSNLLKIKDVLDQSILKPQNIAPLSKTLTAGSSLAIGTATSLADPEAAEGVLNMTGRLAIMKSMIEHGPNSSEFQREAQLVGDPSGNAKKNAELRERNR